MNFVAQSGAKTAQSVKDAATGVDFVVTMLPVGANVRTVFLADGVMAAASPGTVLIDCSTIDVKSARAVHDAAPPRPASPCSTRRCRAARSAPMPRP